ncbi:MAG: hypothetical protein KF866_02245 [Phycisphaeraceae bacterium]|nr:hypothetical protein [Phycisphaeraceae bacterium]MCW5753486.1 hypothetical protein [Phycisphaeraceae bacterium]
MDQIRKILTGIRTHLGKLTATQQLLIAALVVITMLTLVLVGNFSGRKSYVDLMTADGNDDLVRFLRTSHIDAQVRNGRVVVPPDSKRIALASMAESGRLPDDTALLFNSLFERQKWTNSREQNEQLYTVALQNELSRVIADFKGVRNATVILDVPRQVGFGAAVRQPTASATLFMDRGATLSQHTVDAVAAFISGTRSGLDIRNVRVIDGTSGRQFTPSSADEVSATSYIEHQTAVENKTRDKIASLLSYIPGVLVAVTAQVDVARESSQTTLFRSPDDGGTVSLLSTESIRTQTQRSAGRAAEPGLRSNVGADINRGSGSTGGFESSETDTTMDNRVGSVVTHKHDPKGMPTRLAASISIPRGYVQSVLAGQDPSAPAPPDEEIQRKFEEIKADISAHVLPHLKTERGDGEVNVSMTPLGVPAAPEQGHRAGFMGGMASGNGPLGLGGGIVQNALLVVLSLVSLGLMFTMVRKAARPAKLPSADELVGIPPPLETSSDLIGEADETDPPMTGIELMEGDVARTKMLEQVRQMVDENPDFSAKLVNRWITSED